MLKQLYQAKTNTDKETAMKQYLKEKDTDL
jgi:hypothetical protein